MSMTTEGKLTTLALHHYLNCPNFLCLLINFHKNKPLTYYFLFSDTTALSVTPSKNFCPLNSLKLLRFSRKIFFFL